MNNHKKVVIKVDGKIMLNQFCDKVCVQCMVGTRGCSEKGEHCKGCSSQNLFGCDLMGMAYDWAWYGGGHYEVYVGGIKIQERK